MKYSVIIVTYNRINLLKECINQVLKQKYSFSRVMIINNCSTDGTKEYLDRIQINYSNLKVFHLSENLGGAGGFAYGLSQLDNTTDYVLIIDDDAMICDDFLEKLNDSLTAEVLAYSCTICSNGLIDTSHRRRLVNQTFLKKKDVLEDEYRNNYFEYDLATFCGLLISTKLVSKIGLPKSQYFIWYDDTEYSLRIRQYSSIRNINAIYINHKSVITKDRKLNWKSYYGYRNMWDMGLKYSRHPVIYHVYRSCFHICKIIICIFNIVTNKKKKYNLKILHLHIDVLTSIYNKKLGINDKYTFSTKME